MVQTTLDSYDRDTFVKFLLGLGWSLFDARCLMRTKLNMNEAIRVNSGRITHLQHRLLFDDRFRTEKLTEMFKRSGIRQCA